MVEEVCVMGELAVVVIAPEYNSKLDANSQACVEFEGGQIFSTDECDQASCERLQLHDDVQTRQPHIYVVVPVPFSVCFASGCIIGIRGFPTYAPLLELSSVMTPVADVSAPDPA